MTTATLDGKPDAGNPHVRFGEGEVAPAKPRRGSLLYRKFLVLVGAALAVAGVRADEDWMSGKVGAFAALGGDVAAVSPADFGGTDSVRIEKAIARACETGVTGDDTLALTGILHAGRLAPNCAANFVGRDAELPFDQHWLIAALATRLVKCKKQ